MYNIKHKITSKYDARSSVLSANSRSLAESEQIDTNRIANADLKSVRRPRNLKVFNTFRLTFWIA